MGITIDVLAYVIGGLSHTKYVMLICVIHIFEAKDW